MEKRRSKRRSPFLVSFPPFLLKYLHLQAGPIRPQKCLFKNVCECKQLGRGLQFKESSWNTFFKQRCHSLRWLLCALPCFGEEGAHGAMISSSFCCWPIAVGWAVCARDGKMPRSHQLGIIFLGFHSCPLQRLLQPWLPKLNDAQVTPWFCGTQGIPGYCKITMVICKIVLFYSSAYNCRRGSKGTYTSPDGEHLLHPISDRCVSICQWRREQYTSPASPGHSLQQAWQQGRSSEGPCIAWRKQYAPSVS